jgi:hypothetical protein
MPSHNDDPPRTRTETKRSGKKKQGPYSAKHVRITEGLTRAPRPKN